MRRLLVMMALVGCGQVDDPESQTHARVGKPTSCEGIAIETGPGDDITASTDLCKVEKPPACSGTGRKLGGTLTLPTDEDLRGVVCIEGDLLVLDDADGEAIVGLDDLVTVTGNVAIAGDAQFASIAGLPRLRTVGGIVLVQGNDNLVDLGDVARIERAAGFAIIANDHLPDLSGLDERTALPGDLLVASNPELSSVHGLENLASAHAITLRGNPALDSLDALDRLEVASSIEIADASSLATFAPRALGSVGALRLEGNRSLTTLRLVSLGTAGDVTIANAPELGEIGLPRLASAGSIRITGATKLARIAAPDLASAGTLEVIDAQALPTLGLPVLTQISTLTLRRTGLLALGLTLGDLGALAIESCPGLRSLDGLAAITALRSATVTKTGVGSLDGLAALASVTGDFTFTENSMRGEPVKAFVKRVRIEGTTTID